MKITVRTKAGTNRVYERSSFEYRNGALEILEADGETTHLWPFGNFSYATMEPDHETQDGRRRYGNDHD